MQPRSQERAEPTATRDCARAPCIWVRPASCHYLAPPSRGDGLAGESFFPVLRRPDARPAETAASIGDTAGTWIRVSRGSTLRTLPAWDRGGHLRSCPETLGVDVLNPAFPRLPSRLPPGVRGQQNMCRPGRRTARWKGRGQEQEAGGNKCLRAALGLPGDSGETRPCWGAGLHCLIRLRSTNSGTKPLGISRCRPQRVEPRALIRCPGSGLGYGAEQRGLLC